MELLERSKVETKERENIQTANQESSALKGPKYILFHYFLSSLFSHSFPLRSAAEERLEDLRCRLLYLKEKRKESEKSLQIEKSKAIALNDKVMKMEHNAAKMRREKIELQ